jgi:hypothetical protein
MYKFIKTQLKYFMGNFKFITVIFYDSGPIF